MFRNDDENNASMDIRAELEALEREVMDIAGKQLPQVFGVDEPLARLIRILQAMQARIEALEERSRR